MVNGKMSGAGCGGWSVQRLQVQQQHWELRHGAGEAEHVMCHVITVMLSCEHVMLSCDHCHVTADLPGGPGCGPGPRHGDAQ